jgi:hypothetical protein
MRRFSMLGRGAQTGQKRKSAVTFQIDDRSTVLARKGKQKPAEAGSL